MKAELYRYLYSFQGTVSGTAQFLHVTELYHIKDNCKDSEIVTKFSLHDNIDLDWHFVTKTHL